MIGKSRVVFDTSAINRLFDQRTTAKPIIAGLRSGFWLRVTGTNVEEVVATAGENKRTLLLDVCQELMTAGEVIQPFHWIIESLILAFERSDSFVWSDVPIRAPAYEREVAFREIVDNALSRQERQEKDILQAEFEKIYSDALPHFDRIFKAGTESRPRSAAGLVDRLKVQGGAFWRFGIGLYEKKARKPTDEDTIRRFVCLCPPFEVLLYALCAAQYYRCVAPKEDREKLARKRAKRNDLFSSVYLPYCDEFISDDRDQLRCFREIIELANLKTRVLWYGELEERLSGGIG